MLVRAVNGRTHGDGGRVPLFHGVALGWWPRGLPSTPRHKTIIYDGELRAASDPPIAEGRSRASGKGGEQP